MSTPVILLPGVMGSRLYFPNTDRHWDPDSTRRMAFWAPVWPFRSDDDNRRDLHWQQPAGVVRDTRDNNAAEKDRGWSGVVASFYHPFLRRLEEQYPGQVYAVGYDWRQDIGWLGDYAAARLHEIIDAAGGLATVVTHSMGGLVLRAAFHRDPTLKDRIAVVIHICQPSAGAVILYRRLFTGLVRGLDGGGGLSDRVFRLLLGNTRAAFLGNMSGLPGPMQLLPSDHLPPAWHSDLQGGGLVPNLYTNANSPPSFAPGDLGLAAEVVSQLQERAVDVNLFHQLLNTVVAHPTAHLIYGVGQPTEVAIDFTTDPPYRVNAAGGDEVVPAASAQALTPPPLTQRAVSGVKHAEACAHPGVQDAVLNILAPGGFAAPAALAAAATGAAATPAALDIAAWFKAVPQVAAALGCTVRVTVEAAAP